MDYTERLSDLTLEQAHLQQRQAALLTALAENDIGGARARYDPSALDGFFLNRGANSAVKMQVKAAIAAGTIADGTWGGPLAPGRPLLAAHLAAADRRAALPRLGAPRVPATNVVGAAQTAGAVGYWVGESGPKPLSALGYAAFSLTPRKIASDVAVTEEWLKHANVAGLDLIERAAVKAVTETWDTALLDPANAGTANIKPASLTNGLTAVTPAGDLENQIGQVFAAISGGAPSKPALIVNLQTALRLTGLRDLAAIGVNVIVTSAAGNRLIAIDADGIVWVDDSGDLIVGEPDLEMSDTPTATSTAATVMVSSFQRNLKVVRSERFVNWAKRADAVAYLTLA